MKKPRDEKIARTVHVKNRTRGDYNELSFNILDKRNSRFEKKALKSKKASSYEGLPLITVSGGRKKRRGRMSEQTRQVVWKSQVVQPDRGSRGAQGDQSPIDASPDELLFSSGVIGNPEMEPIILLPDELKQASARQVEQGVAVEGGPSEAPSSSEGSVPEVAEIVDGAAEGGVEASNAAFIEGGSEPAAAAAFAPADLLDAGPADTGLVAGVAGTAASTGIEGGAEAESHLHVSYAEPISEETPLARFASDELAYRKRQQRRAVVRALISVAIVAVVLVVCVLLVHQLYEKNQSSEEELQESIDLVSQADEALDALDAALLDPFGEDADELRAAAQEELSDARAVLAEAAELSSEAAGELDDPEDRALAEQVDVAISARQEMLDLGEELMEAAEEAQFAIDCLESAWNCMLNAADLASEAALLVSDTTDENVEESKALTESALEELALAREQLELAESNFDIDLSAYFAYVDKREEALNCAIASDEALLNDDSEEAQAQNDAYNAADEEAADLAAALPEDPTAFVVETFEELMEENEEEYDAARSSAATADAFIRDYSGS